MTPGSCLPPEPLMHALSPCLPAKHLKLAKWACVHNAESDQTLAMYME